jgi:hypothetical protein
MATLFKVSLRAPPTIAPVAKAPAHGTLSLFLGTEQTPNLHRHAQCVQYFSTLDTFAHCTVF